MSREILDPPFASGRCFRSLGAKGAAVVGLGKPPGRTGKVPWTISVLGVHHLLLG